MTTTYAGDVIVSERLTFDQLSPASRIVARLAVLDRERSATRRLIRDTRKLDINQIINDGHRIRAIVRGVLLVERLTHDMRALDRFIVENLCHFLEDGTYITYFRE